MTADGLAEVLLGSCSTTMSASLALPQFVTLLRRRTTAPLDDALRRGGIGDLSIRPWQALLAATAAWLVYGFTRWDVAIVASNVLSILPTGAVVAMIARRAATPRLIRAFVLPLIVAVALTIVIPFPVWFGICASLPSTVGWSVQAVEFRRHGRAPAFSVGGLLLYIVCESTWLSYGVLRHDVALIYATALLVLIATITLATYVSAPAASSEAKTGRGCH